MANWIWDDVRTNRTNGNTDVAYVFQLKQLGGSSSCDDVTIPNTGCVYLHGPGGVSVFDAGQVLHGFTPAVNHLIRIEDPLGITLCLQVVDMINLTTFNDATSVCTTCGPTSNCVSCAYTQDPSTGANGTYIESLEITNTSTLTAITDEDCGNCTSYESYHSWERCSDGVIGNLTFSPAPATAADNQVFFDAMVALQPNITDNTAWSVKDVKGNCWKYHSPTLSTPHSTTTAATSVVAMCSCSTPTDLYHTWYECSSHAGAVNLVPLNSTNTAAANQAFFNQASTASSVNIGDVILVDSTCYTYTGSAASPIASYSDGNFVLNYSDCSSCNTPSSACSYSWVDRCNSSGLISGTINLSGGADLNNITTTLNGGAQVIQSICSAPATIDFSSLSTGDVIKVVGECSYSRVDFNPATDPTPLWATETCGQTTSFTSNTDVYVWYDTSSWGADRAISAYLAIESWLADQTASFGWSGSVYHTMIGNEKYVKWAEYPMTGDTVDVLTLGAGGVPGADNNSVSVNISSYFASLAAWITHNNVPNWYHSANFQIPGGGSSAVTKDILGNSLSTTQYVSSTALNKALLLSNAGVGYPGPAQFATGLPPTIAAGGNLLNIIFLDEATDYNTDASSNNSYGNPTGSGGYASSSTTNTSTLYTFKKELQVKPKWQDHYNTYVTAWKAWGGQSRTFIYPVNPGDSPTNQHYGTSQLFAASIFNGNNTPSDGHFKTGTADVLHPVQLAYGGSISLFEPGSNQGVRHNVFWDKPNATHPDYGYGGLENYGWGANVLMDTAGFTQPVFNADLTGFLNSNTSVTSCDDSHCVVIEVQDGTGNIVPNYAIDINGIAVGSTNNQGKVHYNCNGAQTLLLNACYSFGVAGNCNQTKITIQLAEDTFTVVSSCTGGCTDPTATNYDPLLLIDCAGNLISATSTPDYSCCTYPVAITGCTDPTSITYDPLATIDDGSCLYPAVPTPVCSYNWSELCTTTGSVNVTLDLSSGSSLNNITSSLNAGALINESACAAPSAISFPGLTVGDTVEVTGECSYTREHFNPNTSTSTGSATPAWALPNCGQTQVSANTKIYMYFDSTSLGVAEIQHARAAAQAWIAGLPSFTPDLVPGSPGENVFSSLVAGERWLDWSTSAFTGVYNNGCDCGGRGSSPTGPCSGMSETQATYADSVTPTSSTQKFWEARAWVDDPITASGYHFYDGGDGVTVMNVSTGGPTFPSTSQGAAPSVAPTDDILVLIFADESTVSDTTSVSMPYHRKGNTTTDPTWEDAADGSTGDGINITSCWKNDHSTFVAAHKTHTGNFNGFIYPSLPDAVSAAHHTFPLQVVGVITSGDSGTGTLAVPPANSLSNLSALTKSNPYFAQGYGGLDQYGWGYNVDEVAFTSAGFAADLDSFIGTGGVSCNGDECLHIEVVDSVGTLVPNYPLVVNGVSLGVSGAQGALSHTVTGAGVTHTVNGCYTFTGVGGCTSTKITIHLATSTFTTSLVCLCGCMDPSAINYNPLAVCDDGSCLYCTTFGISETHIDASSDLLSDGSIDVTVLGGTAPYTYNWVSGQTTEDLSNLAGGLYTINVLDSIGCSANLTVAIDAPPSIIYGCTDPTALNYNPLATLGNGLCKYPAADCIPESLPSIQDKISKCVARDGNTTLNLIKSGRIDDCTTAHAWVLLLVQYLISRQGLPCVYNCQDTLTPDPDKNNPYKANYLENFLTFVNHHCDDCDTKQLLPAAQGINGGTSTVHTLGTNLTNNNNTITVGGITFKI